MLLVQRMQEYNRHCLRLNYLMWVITLFVLSNTFISNRNLFQPQFVLCMVELAGSAPASYLTILLGHQTNSLMYI